MSNDLRSNVRGRALARSGAGRALREASGISLRELARVVGVDPSTLSCWERGLFGPRRHDAAVRYAETLAVIEEELALASKTRRGAARPVAGEGAVGRGG